MLRLHRLITLLFLLALSSITYADSLTHAQGEAFVMRVVNLWKAGDVKGFQQVYAPTVTGSFDLTNPLNYNDIQNRFAYVAANNTDRNFLIKNIMVDGNQVMLFFVYTAYDTKLKQKLFAPTMWLFTIKNNQIVQAEILTSLQLNYKAAT